MEKAFSIFADERGTITLEELKLLLKDSLTQDEEVDEKALNKLIKQVDLDGDGKISYEEFVNMALGSPTGCPSSAEASLSSQRDSLKDASKENDSTKKEPSVTEISLDNRGGGLPDPDGNDTPPAEASRDGSSRHLQNAIARASQRETKSRSNRDPPVCRAGCADPPPEEERLASLTKKKISTPADPEPTQAKLATSGKDAEKDPDTRLAVPPAPPQQPPSSFKGAQNGQQGSSPRGRRRISARDARLEEACEGFDRVQEKIARLRMLLTAQDTDLQPSQPPRPRRSRNRKPSPNIETLDSAFAKLSQIQSKMRALQALVKSNQI